MKFIETPVCHRDAGYHEEGTFAAKNFVESIETNQNVSSSLKARYAMQMRKNGNMFSIVKTVMFCASKNIPLCGPYEDEENFMKLSQFSLLLL